MKYIIRKEGFPQVRLGLIHELTPEEAREQAAERLRDMRAAKRQSSTMTGLRLTIAELAQRYHEANADKWTETTPREVRARYAIDLDDGVMVNSAALWPLLEPQWKDPKKWWKELATAQGKKDYDWSHLAARYFPDRVRRKCQSDPSLAVAHGCFWTLHPAKAYAWELRLQDEIRPEFTIDEVGFRRGKRAVPGRACRGGRRDRGGRAESPRAEGGQGRGRRRSGPAVRGERRERGARG